MSQLQAFASPGMDDCLHSHADIPSTEYAAA